MGRYWLVSRYVTYARRDIEPIGRLEAIKPVRHALPRKRLLWSKLRGPEALFILCGTQIEKVEDSTGTAKLGDLWARRVFHAICCGAAIFGIIKVLKGDVYVVASPDVVDGAREKVGAKQVGQCSEADIAVDVLSSPKIVARELSA